MSMTTRCFDCLGTAKCSSCGGSGAAATGVRCHCEGKAARCVRCNGTGFEIPEKGCTRCSAGSCARSASDKLVRSPAMGRTQKRGQTRRFGRSAAEDAHSSPLLPRRCTNGGV